MDPFKPYQPKLRTKAPPLLTDETAEAVALQAVTFIVADEELLDNFMTLSGCGPDEIRQRICERNFLVGTLEYLIRDEQSLLRFTNEFNLMPEVPMKALAILSS